MANKENYDWKNMSDLQLSLRLKEEEWNAQHKNKRVDRAIARKNVQYILSEQTRRYEANFFEG
jgi:hypothetical protein